MVELVGFFVPIGKIADVGDGFVVGRNSNCFQCGPAFSANDTPMFTPRMFVIRFGLRAFNHMNYEVVIRFALEIKCLWAKSIALHPIPIKAANVFEDSLQTLLVVRNWVAVGQVK